MTTLPASPPMTSPRRQSRPKRSFSWLRFLLGSLTLLIWIGALAAAGVVAWYQYNHTDRIYEGVSVRGINLSGMTQPEARTALANVFDPYPLTPVTVTYGDQTWTLSAKDLGVNFDADSAAQAAFRVGRSPVNASETLTKVAQFQANLQQQLAAYRFGHDVLADEAVDRAAGLDWLDARAQEINRSTTEATLRLNGLDISTTPSQVGYALDVADSLDKIYAALLANEGGTVNLQVKETLPLLADVKEAEAFIRLALSGPITLASDTPDVDTGAFPPTYTISTEELAPLVSTRMEKQADGTLRMVASFDEKPLRPKVEAWAAELARDPRNAEVTFNPSTYAIGVVTYSQTGRSLNVDETMTGIRQAVLGNERKVTLPLTYVNPAINTHTLDQWGINEIVSEGSSTFKGSSPERMHNIATAAAAVDNTVVPPGGIFSFNQSIGSVSKDYGYQDALVIWGDRTAVGVGGGVCQVSTTAFRAAFYGGFPIVERWNHGYVVSWYGTPGLDATIYTPTVDFQFRNTTNHHLIIKTFMDANKGTLLFRFYGTRPNWTVTVTGPDILKEVPAPPAVYENDPTLAPGQVKQVEWSSNGMDVAWYRVIRDSAGNVISNETLHSSYTPWAAHYLVGPKVVSNEAPPAEAAPAEAAPAETVPAEGTTDGSTPPEAPTPTP